MIIGNLKCGKVYSCLSETAITKIKIALLKTGLIKHFDKFDELQI